MKDKTVTDNQNPFKFKGLALLKCKTALCMLFLLWWTIVFCAIVIFIVSSLVANTSFLLLNMKILINQNNVLISIPL